MKQKYEMMNQVKNMNDTNQRGNKFYFIKSTYFNIINKFN